MGDEASKKPGIWVKYGWYSSLRMRSKYRWGLWGPKIPTRLSPARVWIYIEVKWEHDEAWNEPCVLMFMGKGHEVSVSVSVSTDMCDNQMVSMKPIEMMEDVTISDILHVLKPPFRETCFELLCLWSPESQQKNVEDLLPQSAENDDVGVAGAWSAEIQSPECIGSVDTIW